MTHALKKLSAHYDPKFEVRQEHMYPLYTGVSPPGFKYHINTWNEMRAFWQKLIVMTLFLFDYHYFFYSMYIINSCSFRSFA